MKKTYIAPETEIIKTLFDSLLVNASQIQTEGQGGDNGGGGGGGPTIVTPTDPQPDPNTPPFARQHNNWMWDTMEDDF